VTVPWLVGLDVDGTIILQDETMSPGVPEAVARVRDAGHIVTIATGRSWAATERWVDELGISADFVVCSNGAVTMRRVEGGWERWHVETFDPSAVLSLLTNRLPEAHYMVELDDGTRLFTGELADEPVSRVVVVSPGHDEDDFHRIVAETGLNEVSYAIGWTAWLDIAPQGVDKGSALARVHAELGMGDGRVLVVGDGRNDVGMFEWARRLDGRAVAMGQAPDEVKDAATEVTGPVEDGGLANALDALLVHPGAAQAGPR
jgi:hydroxymethylpyrimidine pyrophosphatase-like HAD family hydrolase